MLPPIDTNVAPAVPDPDFGSMLPAIYRDGRVAAGAFPVSFARVRQCVPPELYPIELPGSRGLVILCSFDYIDSTLGPYREFGIGIVVSSERRFGSLRALDLISTHPTTGAWLLALPVTSELACRGGVELFGYPKSVASIDVHYSFSFCTVIVEENPSQSVRMTLPLRWGPRFPVRRLVTYSQKDGHLLRVLFETEWRVTISSGNGARLELGNSEQGLPRILRQLELPRTPLFVLHGDRFRAILSAGERV